MISLFDSFCTSWTSISLATENEINSRCTSFIFVLPSKVCLLFDIINEKGQDLVAYEPTGMKLVIFGYARQYQDCFFLIVFLVYEIFFNITH